MKTIKYEDGRVGILVDREKSVPLLKAWRADYDHDGYDFPFFQDWARYRLGAAHAQVSKYEAEPVMVVFKDMQAAVEFKLTWL